MIYQSILLFIHRTTPLRYTEYDVLVDGSYSCQASILCQNAISLRQLYVWPMDEGMLFQSGSDLRSLSQQGFKNLFPVGIFSMYFYSTVPE